MSDLYVNLGTGKCCFFVQASKLLLEKLERYPALHHAVEESLECAKLEYYGIGVIAFAQLLNLLSAKNPVEEIKLPTNS